MVMIAGYRLRQHGYEEEKDMILPRGGEDGNIRTGNFEYHELRKAVAALTKDITVICDRPLISIEISI